MDISMSKKNGAKAAAIPSYKKEFYQNQLEKARVAITSDPQKTGEAISAAIIMQDLQTFEFFLKSPHDITSEHFFDLASYLIKSNANPLIFELIINTARPDLSLFTNSQNQTLLHIAAQYGNEGAVLSMLRSQKFNVNMQDSGGQTPLWQAVYFNRAEVIKHLTAQGADINISDKGGRSPLHLAALVENTLSKQKAPKINLTKILNPTSQDKEKTSPNSSFGSYDNIKFKKYSLKSQDSIPEYKARDNSLYSLTNDFYKAISSPKQTAEFAGLFIKRARALVDNPPADLISVDFKLIGEKLFQICAIVKSFKVDSMLQLIADINSKIIHQAPLLKADCDCFMATFHDIISIKYLSTGNYEEAYNYSMKALNIASPLLDMQNTPTSLEHYKNILSNIYYNLGIAKKAMYSLDEAISYLESAEKYCPDNREILDKQIVIHLKTKNFAKLQFVVSKLASQETKGFFSDYIAFKSCLISNEKLQDFRLKIQGMELDQYSNIHKFDLLTDISLALGDYAQAINYKEKAIALSGDYCRDDMMERFIEVLGIFQNQEKWVDGLAWLNTAKAKFIDKIETCNNHLILQYCTFFFYEIGSDDRSKAEELLQEIRASSKSGTKAAKHVASLVNKIRFYNEIEDSNFDKASECLKYIAIEEADQFRIHMELANKYAVQKALEAKPTPSIDPSVSLAAAAVEESQDDSEAFAILDSMQSSKLLAPTTAAAAASGAEDVLGVTASAEALGSRDEEHQWIDDPRVLHRYFQTQKKKLAQQKFESLGNQAKVISWALEEGLCIANQNDAIELKGKKNFYVSISEKLKLQMPEDKIEAFVGAINAGTVTSSEGEAGVKFFGSTIFSEVKIFGRHGNSRLYTHKIFKNPEGKYLIRYDKLGDHKEISVACKQKMHVISTVDPSDAHFIPDEPIMQPLQDCIEFSDDSRTFAGDSGLGDSKDE